MGFKCNINQQEDIFYVTVRAHLTDSQRWVTWAKASSEHALKEPRKSEARFTHWRSGQVDGHSYLLLHLQLWEKQRTQLAIRHIKGDHTNRNHRLLAMLFTGYPLQPGGKTLLLKEKSYCCNFLESANMEKSSWYPTRSYSLLTSIHGAWGYFSHYWKRKLMINITQL